MSLEKLDRSSPDLWPEQCELGAGQAVVWGRIGCCWGQCMLLFEAGQAVVRVRAGCC